MLREISELLQALEGPVLQELDAKEGLAFSGPEGHTFAPDAQVIAKLALSRETFLELLYLVLLHAKQSVAAAPFRVDSLCLVREHLLLGLHEFAQCLAPKVDNERVQLPLEALHVLITGQRRILHVERGRHAQLLLTLQGKLLFRIRGSISLVARSGSTAAVLTIRIRCSLGLTCGVLLSRSCLLCLGSSGLLESVDHCGIVLFVRPFPFH